MPPKPTGRVMKKAPTPKNKRPSTTSLKAQSSLHTSSTSSKTEATQVSLNNMSVNVVKAEASAPTKKEDGPVYFWRPHDFNGYLGQWYESEFTIDDITYPTAEMWMMVQKAKLFGDENVAKRMLQTTDPKAHKALGREVKNFDDKLWNRERLRIVVEGNYHKFTISKDAQSLREQLLATGERELVEASPMDRIWGVGFGEKNAEKNRYRWGLNLLGKALMEVRGRLREEAGKEGVDGDGKGEVL